MTRVNLVDPNILTDQHLIAERLELTFVISSARRSLHSRYGLQVGSKYTLGKGHVIFFHNKLLYILKRWELLSLEMSNRGMKPISQFPDVFDFPNHMFLDYIPSNEDLVIIKTRIKEKINMKPSWYKYKGHSLDDSFLCNYNV